MLFIRQTTAISLSPAILPATSYRFPSWITTEFSSNSTTSNRHFNVGQNQPILSHLFKEVWDYELVLALPHFLADSLYDCQSTLPAQSLSEALSVTGLKGEVAGT